MAEDAVPVSQQQTKPIKIKKWKIREGTTVSMGRMILIYEFPDAEKPEQRKLKAAQAGIIHKILAEVGSVVQPGQSLYEIKACSHPTIMNDMCAECGADLRKDDIPKSTASVPMIHAIPDLKVSEELAQKLGQADSEQLLKDRKLVLLVDLDQTLIHTTNDNIPPNIKDVYHFQLYGPKSPWYHTRLRPGTHKFLESICNFYELHICTFGARNYAHMIAMFLDPEQKFFSNRILSRDECFDPSSKKANLKALFPCGDDMVCIIDDREDVWSHATNLIHVKPYHFFQHTGDINAPPGLDKHEADDKEGVDLSKLVNNSSGGKDAKKIAPESSEKVTTADDAKNSKGNQNLTEEAELLNEKNKDINDEESQQFNNVVPSEKSEGVNEHLSEEIKAPFEECKNVNEAPFEECKNVNEAPNEENNINEIAAVNVAESQSKVVEEGGAEIVIDDGANKKENKLEEIIENNDQSKAEDLSIKTCENGSAGDGQSDKTVSAESTNSKVPKSDPPSGESNGKLKAVSGPEVNKQQPQSDGDFIEIEDPDDYLVYLEDILKNIHSSYYDLYDRMESGKIPDLKKVIPYVKTRILKGCKLVFSGLVPTHCKLEESKAYQVARSLGAEVQGDIDDETTHLVAVRPGTAKVIAGRRKKNLKIVTPDWLWCCAERWEQVDERVFPLNAKGSKNRHPPPHCSSPEHVPCYPEHDTPALRKRTPSGRFMDTINPLMSFSRDDIADMDKEVEDILDDDTDDSEERDAAGAEADQEDAGDEGDTDVEEAHFKHMIQTEILDTYAYDTQQDDGEREATKNSESDEETIIMAEDEEKRITRKRRLQEAENHEEELPSRKFRRGEELADELDIDESLHQDDNDSDSFEAPDDEDDREWNMMGAALEREFLSD